MVWPFRRKLYRARVKCGGAFETIYEGSRPPQELEREHWIEQYGDKCDYLDIGLYDASGKLIRKVYHYNFKTYKRARGSGDIDDAIDKFIKLKKALKELEGEQLDPKSVIAEFLTWNNIFKELRNVLVAETKSESVADRIMNRLVDAIVFRIGMGLAGGNNINTNINTNPGPSTPTNGSGEKVEVNIKPEEIEKKAEEILEKAGVAVRKSLAPCTAISDSCVEGEEIEAGGENE